MNDDLLNDFAFLMAFILDVRKKISSKIFREREWNVWKRNSEERNSANGIRLKITSSKNVHCLILNKTKNLNRERPRMSKMSMKLEMFHLEICIFSWESLIGTSNLDHFVWPPLIRTIHTDVQNVYKRTKQITNSWNRGIVLKILLCT